MDWQEIIVTVEEEVSEAVADILQELGSGGVVIDDPAVVKHHLENSNWDAHDLPTDLVSLEKVRIKAYYPIDEKLPGRLEEIKLRLDLMKREIVPGSILAVDFSKVAEEDWAHAWKAFYKPVRVGEKIVIKPTWEEYIKKENDLIIELDPGMAFGTGTHATTTMCLQALEEVIRGEEFVYDVGTGSGVLAIAAAKLGAGKVKAIDLDATAVKVAAENVALNHVDDWVTVMEGNLLDMVSDKASVVVANIIASVIIHLCPAVKEVLLPGGIFIASGIINDRWPEVEETLKMNGFILIQIKREKEWVAVIAEKGE